MTGDITKFLLARLNEEQRRVDQVANNIGQAGVSPGEQVKISGVVVYDPAQVLRDIESRRRIIKHLQPRHSADSPTVLRMMATAYSSHPDYSPYWA